GTTYLGVHYGNGQGGPGEGTAFYVLNAAEGINKIHLAYDASSNLVVFTTGTLVSEAPEPSSWAMMIGGFGMIGATLRRRKVSMTFA
ncbi:MAG TPA: PEPxxWA-CTERM sorting domain-containing protein, partial [Sphingomonas sp.]|nr:PEPxxWA-CTERM sorting domain-containing protein [Sphingomonas sp.]